MKEVLSVENMRRSDAQTIASGIPGKELMKKAGKAVFDAVPEWKPPVAVVCGTGNNAGDGYVIAGLLFDAGIECRIFLTDERFSEDGAYFYDICRKKGIEAQKWNGEEFKGFGTVVDCIFGTGFKGKVKEPAKTIIDNINGSGAYVVSVDINSGLNGDTGLSEEKDGCVRSDITVSIGSFKPGHFLNMAKDVMKQKVNCDIGIAPVGRLYLHPEENDIAAALPKRDNYSHKGTYGYTALIGGSERYSGAIRLAYLANAAMRSGAGVVKAALPASLIHDVSSHILESTVFPLSEAAGKMVFKEDEFKELTGNVKSVAFGMGVGISEETKRAAEYLLREFPGKLIIDADGLTALAGLDRKSIKNAKGTVVLTPHLKEFSRLCGKTIEEIQAAPIPIAEEYARETGVILLLKGCATIITDGERTYITDTGCPGMASAGSGDVLSGILSAVCAYIDDTVMAVTTGAYINGKAGELAEQKSNPISMTAGDTAACITEVISKLYHTE